MTKPILFRVHAKQVRDQVRVAKTKALEIHNAELELIKILSEIDQRRYYVRYGFKSLRTFCRDWLRFTSTQSQRLVTEVRRYRYSSKDASENVYEYAAVTADPTNAL